MEALDILADNRPDSLESYDMIAEFYDEDMGFSNPGLDTSFYVGRASRLQRPILELACGTGRISLPLVQSGKSVDALDSSLPMLQQMRAKAERSLTREEQKRLKILCRDMREFNLEKSYALILCAYSAFTYMTEDEDRARALEKIRGHLDPEGIFILDLFVPHYDFLLLPDELALHDYRRERPDGTYLERDKRVQKDLSRQMNTIIRTYRECTSDGSLIRTFTTRETIRYYFHSEMRLILEKHGFAIGEELGDFVHPYNYQCRTMAFVCRLNGKPA